MKKSVLLLFLICLASVVRAFNFYSPVIRQQRVIISGENKEFFFEYPNVIINSVTVFNDEIQLEEDRDFQIDYSKNVISFNNSVGNFWVEYLIYPENIRKYVQNFQTVAFSDSTKIELAKRKKYVFIYDPNLQISGNKTISITVANNADFKLDQSLYLKIDGELSDNLMIAAQLSDSQSPITPEGDSKELSSIDKIFLKLYGEEYELSFGDLELAYPQTEFMDYSPKFEGLLAGWYPSHKIYGALAISKGERITVEISGIEAKQGPYYLSYENSTGVEVVPGSESVFLDGSKKQRGDDYSIDYSEGSITFSNKNFLTQNSKIRVTFQYSNEEFRQNMYLASAEFDITDKLSLSSGIILQNDDKSNPLQTSFSENDLDTLQVVGDGEAWGSGVFEVEDGEYLLNDLGHFEFVANDTTVAGTHNLAFTDVGSGNGDYIYDEDLQYYVFVGENNGDFLPIRKLPVPKSLGNYDLRLNYEAENYQIFTEAIVSDFDKNSNSDLDDNDNVGYAISSGINFSLQDNIIKPELSLKYQLRSSKLKTISETVDAKTVYEIIALPDTLQKSSLSSSVGFDFADIFKPKFTYSKMVVRDYATQNYLNFSTFLRQKYLWPTTTYRFMRSETEYEENSFSMDSSINQQEIDAGYIWKIYNLRTKYLKRENLFDMADNNQMGVQNRNLITTLGFNKSGKMHSELFYQIEKIDSLNTSWQEAVTTNTLGLDFYFQMEKSEVKLSAVHREVIADSTVNYDMVGLEGRRSFYQGALELSGEYGLQNLQFYPKIRQLEYVGEELGIYDSLGIVVEDGTYDFVVTNIDYDNPQMSVEVIGNLALNINPKIITNSYLERFEYETYLTISENSSSLEKAKIYFLDNSITMNEETTIYGKQSSRQTLWYDLIKKKMHLKIETNQSNILDNRYQNSELNEVNVSSFSADYLGIKNSNFQLEYEIGSETSSRLDSNSDQNLVAFDYRRRVNSNFSFHNKLAYILDEGTEADLYYINKTIESRFDFTWFLVGKYRIIGKLNYKRNEREGGESNAYLDKNSGNAYKWDANFNYRINKYTYSAIKYSGEKNPKQDSVHKFTVEIKAEF